MVRSTALSPEPLEFGFNSFQTNPQDSAGNAVCTETNPAQVHTQQNWTIHRVLSTKREVTGANGTVCILQSAHVSALKSCQPQTRQRLQTVLKFSVGSIVLPLTLEMKEVAGTRAGNDSPDLFGKTTEEEQEEGGKEDDEATVAAAPVTILSEFDRTFTLKLTNGTSHSC